MLSVDFAENLRKRLRISEKKIYEIYIENFIGEKRTCDL